MNQSQKVITLCVVVCSLCFIVLELTCKVQDLQIKQEQEKEAVLKTATAKLAYENELMRNKWYKSCIK